MSPIERLPPDGSEASNTPLPKLPPATLPRPLVGEEYMPELLVAAAPGLVDVTGEVPSDVPGADVSYMPAVGSSRELTRIRGLLGFGFHGLEFQAELNAVFLNAVLMDAFRSGDNSQ